MPLQKMRKIKKKKKPAPKIKGEKSMHTTYKTIKHWVHLEMGARQPMWGFYEHKKEFILGYQLEKCAPTEKTTLWGNIIGNKIKCAKSRTNGYFMLLTSTYPYINLNYPSSHKCHSSYADRNKSLDILTSAFFQRCTRSIIVVLF